MAQNRKPTPKTQKQISQEQITPYDTERGNVANTGAMDGSMRAEKLSFKDDTIKPFSIGIKDIDEAINYYFNEVIKPFVIQNNQRIAVPTIYGDAEVWKQIQKDGFYRDKNGRIMSPLIIFKRDNLIPNRTISNKLDANQPHLYSHWTKKYSKRNFYSSFDVLNNTKPEREHYAIVIPDYVTIKYSCIIFTYYQEQMNKIVEAINYASDSYWGDPQRFKFNARIDGFNTVTEVVEGKDRAVKSTFEIKLNGHIIPDVLQKDMNAIKKIPDITKIIWGIEASLNNPSKPSL